MNITQKQRVAEEQLGVFQLALIFNPCFLDFLSPTLSLFLSPLLCLLLSYFQSILKSLCVSPCSSLNPCFSLLYSSLLPLDGKKKIPSLFRIPFLSRYCEQDLRQEMCEFKDLYSYQINSSEFWPIKGGICHAFRHLGVQNKIMLLLSFFIFLYCSSFILCYFNLFSFPFYNYVLILFIFVSFFHYVQLNLLCQGEKVTLMVLE